MSPYVPPTSEQVRTALVVHLAKKLGLSRGAVAHLIQPLSNDALARCLRADAGELRDAVLAAVSVAMRDAA